MKVTCGPEAAEQRETFPKAPPTRLHQGRGSAPSLIWKPLVHHPVSFPMDPDYPQPAPVKKSKDVNPALPDRAAVLSQ